MYLGLRLWELKSDIKQITKMALASPPSTPPALTTLTHILSNAAPATTFDVVSHYDTLMNNDKSLTPPIAAIESLLALLTHTPLTTVSETLALLSHQCNILLRVQLNPIPLSAGTDLFQRYLIAAFQQRSSAHTDFSTLRSKLVSNSKLFVSRAKNASKVVAASFLPFISDDSTIFTYSNTTLLSTITQHAVDKGRYFTLIDLTTSTPTTTQSPSPSIPTSTLPLASFPSALSSLSNTNTILVISAHAVFSNGALLAPLGTNLLTSFASTSNIPVYCCIESFNFVRSFPLGTSAAELKRLGVRQDVLHLSDVKGEGGSNQKQKKLSESEAEMVEIVPAELITALVTENGIMTPSAVSEELIKLWF